MRRRFPLHVFLVCIAGVLLIGCSSAAQDAQHRMDYVDAHPELSDTMAEGILNERVMMGMTEEMVDASWGDPSRVEELKDETASTLWVYGNAWVGGPLTNLYFDEEGILIKYEVQELQSAGDQAGTGEAANGVIQPSSSTEGSLAKGPSNY